MVYSLRRPSLTSPPDFAAHTGPDAATRATGARRLAEGLAECPDVAFAYLHGSFAEGLPYHDLDVAIYLTGDVSADRARERSDELSVALGRRLRADVDVQVLNFAPMSLRHAVLQGTIILARDPLLLSDFIEHVALAYMEYAEPRRRQLEDALRPCRR